MLVVLSLMDDKPIVLRRWWRPLLLVGWIPVALANPGHAPAQTPLSEQRALSARLSDGATSDSRAQFIPEMRWGRDGDWRLLLNGDTRIRAEMRLNQDQNNKRADDDRFFVMRSRLSGDLTYRRYLRVFLEAMDAREIGTNSERNQENDFDTFHQAFLEVAPADPSPWSLRAGLQEIRLGRERRLYNATQWNNLRRTFLAARLMHRSENLDVDLFAGQPRINLMPSDDADGVATGNERLIPGQYVYGTFATLRHRPGHELELYALGQSDREERRSFPVSNPAEDGTLGTLERYTVGASAYGPIAKTDLGQLTYGAGGAYQFGQRSKDDIRAFMLHGDLAHEFDQVAWKPRLALEANWLSGDGRAGDGVQGTFNNLYGSNIPLYSRSAYVRGGNMKMVGPSLRVEPTKKLRLTAAAFQYWLDSDTDAWTDGFGTRVARNRKGVGASGIGHEVSLTGSYRVNKWVTLEAGAAAAVPGEYGARFGREDTSVLGFTQAIINF
jgi:hypothetical protein